MILHASAPSRESVFFHFPPVFWVKLEHLLESALRFEVQLRHSYANALGRMREDPRQPPIESCKNCGLPMDLAQVVPLTVVECPKCSTTATVLERFGPFKLERLLGVGGMGNVYEAMDLTLQRRLALKVLQKTWSHDATLTAQFEREAALTARINHPHVVRVYSTGNAHGMFYIAMELVDKGSLDTQMEAKGRVPETDILRIGLQVAEGLQAAYRAGLIHRDIKPGNILFGEGGHSKIVDFGLALQFSQTQTPSGELWGTPFYIAPEALDFKPEDLRSDMYALGATLWHALVGAPPYACESVSTHELLHARKQPVDLAKIHPDSHPLTVALLNRTLAFGPEDRHSDYESLVRDFRQALTAVEARAPNEKPDTQRNSSTTWRWMLVLIAVAGALTAVVWQKKHLPTDRLDPIEANHFSDEERFSNAARLLAKPGQLDVALRRLELIAHSPSLTPLLQIWTSLALATAYSLRGETDEQTAALQTAISASQNADATWPATCQRLRAALTNTPPQPDLPEKDPSLEREMLRQFFLAQTAIVQGRLTDATTSLEAICNSQIKTETPLGELLQIAPAVLQQLRRLQTFENEIRAAASPAERASRLQRSEETLTAMQPSWPLHNAFQALMLRLKSQSNAQTPNAAPPSPPPIASPTSTTPSPTDVAAAPTSTQPQAQAVSDAFEKLRADASQHVLFFRFAEATQEIRAFRPNSSAELAAQTDFFRQVTAAEALFQWAQMEINQGGLLPSPLLRNKTAFQSDPINADSQRLLVRPKAGATPLPLAWKDVSPLYLIRLAQYRLERDPTYPQRAQLLWNCGNLHLLMSDTQSARLFLEKAVNLNPTYAGLLPALPQSESTP